MFIYMNSSPQEASSFERELEKFGKKIEKQFDMSCSSFFEGLFGVFFVSIFALLLNIFYNDISFFNSDFANLMPLINFSFLVSIIFLFTRIFIWSKKYKAFTEIICNSVFFYIAYRVWEIFPFDTSVIGNPSTWDEIFRVIIIITVVATAIATLGHVLKLVSSK